MGWYRQNGGRRTHPVGEKLTNDFGLHDMHGNALEWCEDWYQADYYDESAGSDDPLCENSGSGSRVVRGGGSWMFGAEICRSAVRLKFHPSSVRYDSLGLRPTWSSP